MKSVAIAIGRATCIHVHVAVGDCSCRSVVVRKYGEA